MLYQYIKPYKYYTYLSGIQIIQLLRQDKLSEKKKKNNYRLYIKLS